MRTIVLVCLLVSAVTAAVLPEGRYLPPEEKAASEYLPPSEEVAEVKAAIEEPQESAALAEDGYRYKTVRKLKYRQRRDVSEIANEYLPPMGEPSNEYLPPAEVKEAVDATDAPEESAILADDGYHYKTARRLKYRQRRDVSEIANDGPTNEYLPPAEVKEAVDATEAPEESAILADDGYHYKTARTLKYRQRRDVSEIVAPEYLPVSEQVPEVKEATSEYLPPAEVKETAVLSADGYQYKTVRRLKYRNRRDVSEIVAPEYLPTVEESAEPKEAEISEESAPLAEDGYRYKTVRKLKYRNRRDVSEIVAPEYLPPVEETDVTTEAPEESAVLADDGYRYKTVRRLKYRKRRDVSEIVNEYLPPAEEVSNEYLPPAEVKEAVDTTEVPEESAVLADDGYHYKTIRRLKYRQRRDVSEIVNPEYLPPIEKVAKEYLPPSEDVTEATKAPIEESAVLADDGYRYKTVKRIRYRN